MSETGPAASSGNYLLALTAWPVTSADGSALSQRYSSPPAAPPTSGATQNSHNCASAQSPTKSAGPVLRAGFTEVLVTGMLMR